MAVKKVTGLKRTVKGPTTARRAVPVKAPAKKAAPVGVSSAQQAKSDEYRRLRAYYDKNGHIPTLLSSESKTRFGESDDKDASELGRQVATGRITKEQAYERIRQGAAVNDPDSLRAGLDVSADLDPKISAATRKRTAGAEALKRLLDQDNKQTAAASTSVGGLYAALAAKLQEQNPQIAANYDQAIQGTQSNTSTLQDSIKAAYAKANETTAARVAGMGGGVTEGQSQGAQDSAFLSGLAGVQGQGQLGQLNAGKTGALNVQGATQNYSNFEGTQTQAGLLRELMSRTTDRQSDFNTADAELSGEITDLESSRFAKLYEGRQSLKDARAQSESEAEQTAFERQLASSKLGIDQGELDVKRANTSIAARRVDNDIDRLGLDRQKVEIQSRQSEQKLLIEQRKFTPGTIEYQEIEASINLKRATAASSLTNARTNQQRAADSAANNNAKLAQRASETKNKANSSYGKGIGGVQNYLKDINADPSSTALVMKHVSNTQKYFKDYQGGLKGIEGWIAKNKPPAEVANAMRRATGIAYGRST